MKRSLFTALLLPFIAQAQTLEFGNLNVIQTAAADASASITLSAGTGGTAGFSISGATSNKGDYDIRFGNTNDVNSGLLFSSVSQNGRDNSGANGSEAFGLFYATSATAKPNQAGSANGYKIVVTRAAQGDEININTAFAYFPFSSYLAGHATNDTNNTALNAITGSAGIDIGAGQEFQNTATAGEYLLNLTAMSGSSANGILLVSGGKDEDNYAFSRANVDGTFNIWCHDNGVNSTSYEADPVAFVYLPVSSAGANSLVALGRINSDASTALGGGTFSVTKGGTGQWYLTIPGHTNATGVLLVSQEGGGTNTSDNIISRQWDSANSRWIIESRDLSGATALPTLQDGSTAGEDIFSFAFFAPGAINLPPVVSISSPATGSSYIAPATFTVTAAATDPDGTISQVEFLRNGVVVGTDTDSPYTLDQSALAIGAYNYIARATDSGGTVVSSTTTAVTVTLDPGSIPANTALLFDGVDDFVTMGAAPSLGVGGPPSNGMTLECWFMKNGTGVTASSGSGGVTALPLFGKGRGEGDGANIDCNYFFGINTSGVLVADFETYPASGLTAGQNYPITGTNTPITNGVWNHAAVTYDGPTATWRLYLNGVAVGTATAAAGALPRYDSIQHFAIGTALNSTGVREGAFPGIIDEVRVWNYARSAAEITASKDFALSSAPGLVGRYGLNEGTGTTTANSISSVPGALTNGPLWIGGATLAVNDPPTVSITAPADNASFSAPAGFTITADAADTGGGTISKVEFFSGATKLGEDTAAPYEQIVSALAQGSYSFTAKATDNLGSVTTSSAIAVTVTPPATTPPTVSITSPADGATFLAPATITINANAADSDGTVEKVEFFNGTTKLGEDTDSPYTFNWSNVAIGSYTLTAKVTDNLTATTTSAAITVNVVVNQAPSVSLTSPADLATGLGASVALTASVSDPESQPMNVTFYGRLKSPPVGPDFTLMTLPDTQFYSEDLNNRFSQFTNQANWIVSSRTALNTVFVSHMGDMVNTASVAQEWTNAKAAMARIEDPLTTLLTHGIPWGGAPGNHDGTGTEWDTHFGLSRWAGKTYFQGGYNSSNRNNYQFFSASGLDFIIIHLDYNSNTAGNQAIMDWADALLKAHPTRRAIVTSHWLINTSFPPTNATWGGHGQAVYDNLKDNPNLFLMLCGHIHGEGRREDIFEGRTVYTVLQDYQSRSGYPGGFGGGDAWLRYFTFSPANNTISAKTYRTTTGDFETDADSQFTLPYTMGAGTAPWTALGTVSASGGTATVNWTGLAGNTEYEWYAAVSDGVNNTGSSTRSFTTAANVAPSVSLTSPSEGATVALPAQVNFTATATDGDGSVAKVEFFAGVVKVGEDTEAPFEYPWTAISGAYALTAVATDNQGASTTSGVVNITVTNPSNVSPSVAITAPTSGSAVATGTVALAANASDTDGVVSKVEFFNGAVEIGEDITSPFTFDWPGVTAGTYTITAVATDNDGGTTTSAPVSVTAVVPVSSTLIAKGATWKYLDNGTDQGSAWKETSFNDAPWASGPAVLGGGDTHIITNVNLGPSGNRYITTYFRRAFNVTGAASVQQLNLNILRDDGVVVYINGTEVARQNMPAGAVNHLTNAVNTIGGTDETTYFPSSASPLPTLVDGNNTIAVEVHQRDGSSSDLGFDMELIAVSLPDPPTVTLVASDAAAGEHGADQAIAFTVSRTGPTTALLNVPLTASGSATQGVDYTGFLSSIAIPIGQASATLPLTVQPDNEAEGAETATVSLGASAEFTAGTPASANAVIADKPEQGFYFANIANPAKRAPEMDADGDSNANVIEYFMGSLPDDANSRGVLEIPTTGTNTFKVRYPRAKNRADVGGSLRWSANLTNWHNGGQSDGTHTVTFVEAVVSATEADPEIIEATATITGPGEASSIFVRLGVQ